MKEVTIKQCAKMCNKELGCGRTIKTGETAYLQMITVKGKRRRRYLCSECYDRRTY